MSPDPTKSQQPTVTSSLASWRDVLLIGTMAVLALYAGSRFLIPLALAILVFVLITALSDRISAISIKGISTPVWLSNLLSVVAVLLGLFSIMFILANQATQFTRALPVYEAQLDAALGRVTDLIGHQIANSLRDNVVNIDISRLALSALGGARSFLTTFFLICLYVAFMMAERTAITQKILLAATSKRFGHELGHLVSAISNSLQRYLGVKTLISAMTGLFSYAVFRLLGLEFAETWGVLTFALNFIPSIGSVVAVIFPALVALVQFESLTPFFVIVFGCGMVQFMIGNLLDPALTGRSLNLSTLVVILALMFWSTIWGIIGAFLSVPLTVCLLIIFSHIPATRPVAIMMSKDGTLHTGSPENTIDPNPDKGGMS